MSTKSEFLDSIGEYFHVYNRGVNRTRIFINERNYEYFLQRMEKYKDPGLKVIAYCLMPTHFHFLVRQDEPRKLSNYLGLVCKSYVLGFNKVFSRSGHLFEGKYKLQHVDEEGYLHHLSRYIHLNPVRAHLVKSPEDWPYSSCREYYGLSENRISGGETILAEFGGPQEYRKFVEAYTPEDRNKIGKYILG